MTSFDYGARVERARQLMAQKGIDVMLLSVGADLPYFSGYEAMPSERLTMLVLGGERLQVLLIPELEAPRVEARPELFELRPWGETEDPLALVAELCGSPRKAAVGDHTWSRFLLGLQERLKATRFVPASSLTREVRICKDASEIDLLRRAGAAVDRVVERLSHQRFSGRSERDLARLVATMTLEEGHQIAIFTIVASGPNGASPHHEPSDRVIQPGDIVVVDFGGRLNGYCSDITRTFAVGSVTSEGRQAHFILEASQAAGREAARPGVPAQEVDRAARKVIADAGYGAYFIHRTGHGIGLEAHEDPYLVEGNTQVLEPGMAFSVEPGIYQPGRFGIRIEDIVVLTDTGREDLNNSPRELINVE